jgi:predicted P-loop ATPase
MNDTALSTDLAYYAANGAALFPIPKGNKSPTGIVGSFKHDFSRDPEQWKKWAAENENCNFGIVAFASHLVIVDIDASGGEAGRTEAWSLWCSLCADWGLPGPLAPAVQSARGGWHVYCAVPPHIDASQLRQPDAIKKRINVRAVGYTVAAGSTYLENGESLPYLLMSNAPPHPCPDALLAHCMRSTTPRTSQGTPPGSRDQGDVAALLTWLSERDVFTAYEDWVSIGMALKLDQGESGFELWELTFDSNPGTPSEAASKWQSFATDPTPQSVTLNTFMQRAHSLGWHGTIRKSSAAMFDGVAALAAATGATLHSAGIPMLGRGEKQAEYGEAILREFLAATSDAPSRPLSDDVPTLPPTLNAHGLYHLLNDAISRVVAMAEPPQKFLPSRVIDVLGILQNVHPDIFEAVCRRVRAMGRTLPDSKIKHAGNAFSNKVERAFVTIDDWKRDHKGEIQNDNSDNCIVFLAQLSLEIRWNLWLERMEIKGGVDDELRWADWTFVDDSVISKLRTRGNRTEIRFRPADRFFWESLESIAYTNAVDPARDTLAALEAEWDGSPRLSTWLSHTAGTPCDPYHQAVSRNIIGGMVRRIRQPGCKHDFMAVFFGPQGTGKSTIATIIADMGKSSLSELARRSTEWFSDEVLLGDASKELVLSLAGKCLVEIGEMGQRNSANVDHVKAMLSRQVDRGRTAYARSVSNRPRRNIFLGTVNGDEPLQDPTGNRRFLPVAMPGELNLQWLSDNIRALLGEAAALESKGADFALPRSVWGTATEHQEAARSASDMEVLLQDWFAPAEHTATLSYITAADLVQLASLCGWRNGGATSARGAIMKRMGFRQEKTTVHGKRAAVWVRGSAAHIADIPRLGVRYTVGSDSHGRPLVGISKAHQ